MLVLPLNSEMNNKEIIHKTATEFIMDNYKTMNKVIKFPVIKHVSYKKLNSLYTTYKTKFPDSYLNPNIFEDYSKNLSETDTICLLNIILDELQYEVSKVLNKDFKHIKESKTIN